jgi:TctA family transporter
MDILHNLVFGLGVAISWQNILYCFIGCVLGTLVGVLPGIGPVATVAMLLPFTFKLGPTPALIMLAGIYYGAQYGGSTTAILVNIPGESSSVVTTLDGYQMARRGRAGPALGIAAIGSFFAGCVATVMIALFAPPLAEVALSFSPAEYFSLMVFGLVAAIVLARGSLIKALGMVCVGLLFGMVGTDVNSGVIRFAFGQSEIADGIGFVALAMAFFGMTDVVLNLENPEQKSVFASRIGSVLPSLADLRMSFWSIMRGTGLGSILGILPGGGERGEQRARHHHSYRDAASAARPRHRLGTGAGRAAIDPRRSIEGRRRLRLRGGLPAQASGIRGSRAVTSTLSAQTSCRPRESGDPYSATLAISNVS